MNVSPRTLVELPPHIPPTFEVYVNGVRQEPGRDFQIVLEARPAKPGAPGGRPRSPSETGGGRSLVFPREIAEEGRLGFWRWASMWLGIAGTYRKHETVDIVYESNGRRMVETGLKLVAES